jgi:hypothetical protein
MKPFTHLGQSSVEYLVVCAALVTALGLGLTQEDSALKQWLQAMRQAYMQWTFAISLPQ